MSGSLFALFQLIQAIRTFFTREGLLDVMTPPMVSNPGMEVHIHPFRVEHVHQRRQTPYYLHTSPEFQMKNLLASGLHNIFTLTYCFRDEPTSPIHRPQFIMLEWYRSPARYEKIMADCEALIRFCLTALKEHQITTTTITTFERATVQELLQEVLGVDILNYLEAAALRELIRKDFPDVPLPAGEQLLAWDDYYFLLFLNKVEPLLIHYPYLLLYEFPHHLSALSTLKESDPRVCERFEIYLRGIELCNCFNELTDLKQQRHRFQLAAKEKRQLYNYSLPTPQLLYSALERGLPPAAGIALGVERLLSALTGISDPFYPSENISEHRVLP